MTLDELDAEARMHGLHVWKSEGCGIVEHGCVSAYYCAIPRGRYKGMAETLRADTVNDMAVMLKMSDWGGRPARHAAPALASEIRETQAQPHIGRRRRG